MEGKKAEELNALEAFLREDDAVMELNILSVLKRYISDKGNPATVVELLSDNYQGKQHTHRSRIAQTIAHNQCQRALEHACPIQVIVLMTGFACLHQEV